MSRIKNTPYLRLMFKKCNRFVAFFTIYSVLVIHLKSLWIHNPSNLLENARDTLQPAILTGGIHDLFIRKSVIIFLHFPWFSSIISSLANGLTLSTHFNQIPIGLSDVWNDSSITSYDVVSSINIATSCFSDVLQSIVSLSSLDIIGRSEVFRIKDICPNMVFCGTPPRIRFKFDRSP